MADRSVSYTFRADIGDFKAKVASLGSAVGDFGNKLTALDAEGANLRGSMEDLADQLAAVGVVAGSGFTAATVASANFEQAMSGVRAATGETAAGIDKLSEAALDAGARTSFSATEAAGAVENLAKAGISTSDILEGALTGSLNLAAAGQLEVAEAAEFTATALTQFSLEGDQASHVADLLAAGAGKAQGEVADLALALNYAGIPAAQLGVSIEETTGTLALFAKNGLIGEKAGTSLRGMLASLTSPSDVAKKKMKELGLSVFDAEGNFVGFEGVAGQLQQRLRGFTDKDVADSLGRIFDTDQLQAANILLREGAEGVAEWTRNVDDAGYAADAAGILLDNLKGDLEGLKGAFETALIGTGSGQQGILRDLTQNVTSLVGAYNALPGPVQSATGSLLGITAITTGGFWLSTRAVSAIADTRLALQGLGLQAATTRQLLVTLGGGAAAFTLAGGTLFDTLGMMDTFGRSSRTADTFAKNFTDLAEAIKDSNIGKYADDLDIDLAKLAQDLYANGAAGEYVTRIQKELAERTDSVGDAFKGLAGDALPIINTATNKAYDANKDLNAIIENSTKVLGTAGDEAKATALKEAALSGAAAELGDSSAASAEDVQALADAMKEARETAQGAVSSFLNLNAGVVDGEFSFEKWIRALRRAANAVRDLRKNADEAAGKGLDAGLVTQFESQGREGALQLQFFAKATDEEIEQANRAWRRYGRQSSETISAVTDDIISLSDLAAVLAPEIPVGIDTRLYDAALGDIFNDMDDVDATLFGPRIELDGTNFFEARLDDLLRPRTLSVRLALANVGAAIGGLPGAILGSTVGQADGGTVAGPRWPYGDKVITALAPGEEVITNRNGEADQFRADRAAGRIPAYANGGTVDWNRVDAGRRSSYSGGSMNVTAQLSRADLDYMADRLQQSRPIYGPINMQPHNYSEFKREMEADRRRAAVGGY